MQIGKMPQITNMRIRVTELFRKIDGEWRLIHRHADMPPR
ncbi:MAG: nuclear transport factor 2 family protein [Gammaproteobacteria bacterium]|nr:nuclear transport factor 2 family protein [Gammaproteobacteria bacterium]